MGRALLGKGLIAFKGYKNVLAAYEELSGQAIARRHVVHFRVHKLFARDFAELLQELLFLFGEGDPVLALPV